MQGLGFRPDAMKAGDVHGCHEQLGTVEYARGVDNLVFVGDLVNKGPGNVQVLDTFLSCPGARAVRGNHDDAVLRRYYAWRDGREELKGQHEWIATLEERHVAALESLPFTLSLPDYGALVVHAGLVPGIELGQQDPWAMYKMRNVVGAKAGTAAFDTATSTGGSDGAGNPRDGALKTTAERGTGGAIGFTTAASREQQQQQQQQPLVPLEDIDGGGEAWAFVWGGPQHVFFGHDARRRLQLHPAATGLDTGCVYGGHLTAAVLPPLASLRPGGLPARLTVRGGGGGSVTIELYTLNGGVTTFNGIAGDMWATSAQFTSTAGPSAFVINDFAKIPGQTFQIDDKIRSIRFTADDDVKDTSYKEYSPGLIDRLDKTGSAIAVLINNEQFVLLG
ncbi:hypothetical protein FOA52_009748, partial [Chlamydomonas sp. UWO 241]